MHASARFLLIVCLSATASHSDAMDKFNCAHVSEHTQENRSPKNEGEGHKVHEREENRLPSLIVINWVSICEVGPRRLRGRRQTENGPLFACQLLQPTVASTFDVTLESGPMRCGYE
jgi:hypothetical protein